MSPRTYPSARNRILDAAEAILVRDGLLGLSVEAVAKEAEVSKGGFFHHFASKEALLGAILERIGVYFDQRIEAATAADRQPRGRRLRAQVRLAMEMEPAERRRMRALLMALIIAASDNEPVRAGAREVNRRALAQAAAEGVSEGTALIVQFALDGYWLAESLETFALDARSRAAFRDALLDLVSPRTKGART